MRYVGRYAPSPTGDLHLGNVLACLVAWVRARQRGGELILRMEDLDQPRVVEGAASRIESDLAWLGFDFDKHPHDDDHFYTQSRRGEAYLAALERLDEQDLLYACRCSRKDIAEAASAPHGQSPVYPGTCRALGVPLDEPQVAWRFRVPDARLTVDDALCGPFTQDLAREVGDFVVRRKDGIVAYHLAVVVDDAEQGVTEVVRGRDLLDSSPRQAALYAALGHEVPAFAHGPLLVDADGRRLAKRDGDLTLGALRERGVAPEVILGWLGEALGASSGPQDLAALRAAIEDDHLRRDTVRLSARLPG